ncbi:MAG: SDR family oxidoreductase [Gammaproteobacteria bacterium]
MSQLIVVTGGATGIGAATVVRFRARESKVIVLDVVSPNVAGVEFIECDLSDPASIDRAIDRLPGSINALVNVAGIAESDRAETVVAVNFLGLRHLTEGLATGGTDGATKAKLATGASIVNVASSAGRDWPSRQLAVSRLLDTADFASGLAWLCEHANEWQDNPYKFSKQCAAAYTYRASAMGIERGLRVNCVNPGAVETRLAPDFKKLIGAGMYDWIAQQVGRHGTPDDVAGVIEFLAVGDCGWLNGVEITVDGGYYAGVVGGWIRPEESPNGTAHQGPSAARSQ